jgi:hypothetical protein
MFPSLASLVKVLTSTLTTSTFTAYETPSLEADEWSRLDRLLKKELIPFNYHLSRMTDEFQIAILGDLIGQKVTSFLDEHADLFPKPDPKVKKQYVKPCSSTLAELKKLKKQIRKQLDTPSLWHSLPFYSSDLISDLFACCKAIGDVKKQEMKKAKAKTVSFQEGLFLKNRYNFSKGCLAGSLESEAVKPTFSREFANQHYSSSYSVPHDTRLEDLHWYPEVKSLGPGSPDFVPFDMSAFKPRDVRAVLKAANHSSTPGPDGIPYGVLYHLPSIHHVLATLFSHVLAQGIPPKSWAQSYIKLIYKAGSTDSPSNFRPIALGNTIGKSYHLLLSKRTTTFLLGNKLIDPKMQKAFLPGISGCTEHARVLSELIKSARQKKRTVHVTFFDLADAFGSVPHDLILHAFRRNFLPPEFINYFELHYGNLESCVKTNDFTTNTFPFRRGVTQGDPMSPIIFLLAFNPVLDFLQSQEKYGYQLGQEKVISLPFADDFCLVTTNKKVQQRLITDINEKIISMGLRLKPSKCRTFSVSSGSSKIVAFDIAGVPIPSTASEEQKFLGKVMFYSGKESDTFDYFQTKFKEKLDFLDKAAIRNEFKLWVYSNYFLSSMRFILTVHDLTSTSLRALDTQVNKYLKKWCELPNCATQAVIHSSVGLNITTLEDLYHLCHSLEVTNVRLRADVLVNVAVDEALAREAAMSKNKTATVTKAQETFVEALTLVSASAASSPPQTMPPPFPSNVKTVKMAVKKILKEKKDVRDNAHLVSLAHQGGLLHLLQKEKINPEWQSMLSSLKKGTVKFILNSHINTLPTRDNLRTWGKSVSDKCLLCRCRDSTLHLLNGCKISLDQSRYTWRHDSVLKFIHSLFTGTTHSVTSDLPGGKKYGDSTINPQLTVTPLKPDIVVEMDSKVIMIELTVPFETNLDRRHEEKSAKYAHFKTDITVKTCTVLCLEIGSRGTISPRNRQTLKEIHAISDKKLSIKQICKKISLITIAASYFIFTQRSAPVWGNPPLLNDC